jgi:hypothetical protein
MKLTRRYKCKFKGVQLKQAATKSKACCYGMIVAAAIDCGCTGYRRGGVVALQDASEAERDAYVGLGHVGLGVGDLRRNGEVSGGIDEPAVSCLHAEAVG